jgi:DNA-binding transcriptional LysR family regulator
MDEAKRAINLVRNRAGPLRIGAPENVLTYRLPTVVSLLRGRFPRFEPVFTPHVVASVFNDLEAGKIDFAFHMCDTLPTPRFRSTKFYREKILLVSDTKNADDALAGFHSAAMAVLY